jgi:hypothetical protein
MLLPEDPEWKCWAEGLRADREVLPVDCMCARGQIIMRTLTKDSTDEVRRFYSDGDAGDQEPTGTAKGRRDYGARGVCKGQRGPEAARELKGQLSVEKETGCAALK